MTVYILLEDFSEFRGVFKSLETVREFLENGGGHIIDEETTGDITYISVDYPREDISNTYRVLKRKIQ